VFFAGKRRVEGREKKKKEEQRAAGEEKKPRAPPVKTLIDEWAVTPPISGAGNGRFLYKEGEPSSVALSGKGEEENLLLPQSHETREGKRNVLIILTGRQGKKPN